VSALRKQYEIDKNVLGAGSFGKVFLGTNLKDRSMKVAIKVINKS
jgi:serine/threonine protein kinase